MLRLARSPLRGMRLSITADNYFPNRCNGESRPHLMHIRILTGQAVRVKDQIPVRRGDQEPSATARPVSGDSADGFPLKLLFDNHQRAIGSDVFEFLDGP
jgi:hypothetical protein